MEKYFEYLDLYIDLKIEYVGLDLDDILNIVENRRLKLAKDKMEMALLLVIKNNIVNSI